MRALALFSGGCDSLISMKLLTMQGIEVIALHFNIGFGGNKDKLEYLRNASAQVGARLEVVDIRKQFFDEVLFTPKYGYGKYFNPCIDCHANMFANAFYLLESFGASFVVSGEVLGQRPKSQRKQALDQVRSLVREVGKKDSENTDDREGKSSGRFDKILDTKGDGVNKPKSLDELLLRPMSAKLLPPSFPERAGWVDREKLLDISGRGRTRQLEMVKKWGWKHYENPGGGCLLTDISVAKKLKDLSAHRKMLLQDSTIVKVGRYMVLPNGARAIIGRNESENTKLDEPNPSMEKIILLESIGPLGLVEKDASKDDKILAARITLGYAKNDKNAQNKENNDEISPPPQNQTQIAQKVKIGEEVYEILPYPKEKAREFLLLK
ncbi:argininosuccinate synthase domain-containing protein [Helicobacter sp. MIT 01-3238]|uniref:argininosuccinate synthase domain-containing protein n=1 Tax=Helicobacter sp. MIT 01-3238 TaxID=398627 RepID=UPI000E1EF0B9|nr:argininosuccinate synthase domain-containing protein [Helicobacter sp. MIT 01-3238]RDU55737.1 ATP-binding protein [Helicobacter sp. MIT 01-3238]